MPRDPPAPRDARIRRARSVGREQALAWISRYHGSTAAALARAIGDVASAGVEGEVMRQEALRGAADLLAEVVKQLRQEAAS